MPCRPLHAMHCLHLADLNSMHCSHTASWSIQPRLRLSLLILPSTTSVSISTTPGAFTWNLPLWIFVGQIIIRAIPLRYAILIGLKAKNSGFRQSKSTVYYAHELPPGTPKPKHAAVIHCWEKWPTCSLHLICFHAVLISFFPFFLVVLFLSFWLKSGSWLKGIPHLPILTFPTFQWVSHAVNLLFDSNLEAALLLQMVLLHHQMPCCPGRPKQVLLKELMKQERLLKPTTLDMRRWSLQFLYHLVIHQALQGKHIHYNRKCHRTRNVTEPSNASHSHFQGGHFPSRVRPYQSPDGDGGRSTWSWTQPSSGVLLQWNCWSCLLLWWWTHQQLGASHPTRQLLSSLLQHSRSTWWRYLLDPHRGKIANDRLTMLTTLLEPMRNSQNPTWKTTLPWLLKQAMCQFQVRSTNWHPCFTTFLPDREYNAPILEARESSCRSKCQPYPVVHGKRSGSPCQPCGNHFADSCPTCSESWTRQHLTLTPEWVDN